MNIFPLMKSVIEKLNKIREDMDAFSGTPGPKGEDGNGIERIEKTAGTGEAGTTDTYTIYYTNGGSFEFHVTNGANGSGGGESDACEDCATLSAEDYETLTRLLAAD